MLWNRRPTDIRQWLFTESVASKRLNIEFYIQKRGRNLRSGHDRPWAPLTRMMIRGFTNEKQRNSRCRVDRIWCSSSSTPVQGEELTVFRRDTRIDRNHPGPDRLFASEIWNRLLFCTKDFSFTYFSLGITENSHVKSLPSCLVIQLGLGQTWLGRSVAKQNFFEYLFRCPSSIPMPAIMFMKSDKICKYNTHAIINRLL